MRGRYPGPLDEGSVVERDGPARGWYYTFRSGPLNRLSNTVRRTPPARRHPKPAGVESTITQPTVIPPSEHGISEADISGGALKVLQILTGAGHSAYLVGGGVRDLLLGLKPKDFDVATGATPETVRRLFRSCRLIGRRFRLAHVRMGREVIEVATFRALPGASGDDPDHVRVDGRIVRDNVYGTLEEDVWRRDFTANCLYYDHRDRTVIDFTGGYADVHGRTLRLIGDAVERYREDPVRMLRAVRFAAKLGFRIDGDTSRAIYDLAPLLEDMPPARLYEEVVKLFMGGAGHASYELLRRYALFGHLFPETEACIEAEPDGFAGAMAGKALESTDARIRAGKPVTPGFLFAALLWEPVRQDSEACIARGMPPAQAYEAAGADVIERQIHHVSLPRRFSYMVREIWGMQPRLVNRRGRGGARRLLTHPRFRAAYDFLLLRAESGEDVGEHAQWWTRLLEAGGAAQPSMTEGGDGGGDVGRGDGGRDGGEGRRRPKRRRRGRRSPRTAPAEQPVI